MQTVIVILIVGASTLYLGILFYKRFFGKETKCEGCSMHQGELRSSESTHA